MTVAVADDSAPPFGRGPLVVDRRSAPREHLAHVPMASARSTTSASRWQRGEICALIGPNGAGKSSLLNVISGALRAASAGGSRSRANGRARCGRGTPLARGIARTFQNIALFRGHDRARERRSSGGRLQAARAASSRRRCALGRAPREERRGARACRSRDPRRCSTSRATATTIVGELPYGLQKRVELARALAAEPKLAAARRADGRHDVRREAGA